MFEGEVTLIGRDAKRTDRYHELSHSAHWVLVDAELIDGLWYLKNHAVVILKIKMTPEQEKARKEYIACKVRDKIKYNHKSSMTG